MGAKDEHKKLLYPAFQLLPSRKKYPDYYEVVEQPVDLKIVTNKVQNNKYKFLFELEKDLLLMCKNACLYNEPGSHIYKQAKVLRKVRSLYRLGDGRKQSKGWIILGRIGKNDGLLIAKNQSNQGFGSFTSK